MDVAISISVEEVNKTQDVSESLPVYVTVVQLICDVLTTAHHLHVDHPSGCRHAS